MPKNNVLFALVQVSKDMSVSTVKVSTASELRTGDFYTFSIPSTDDGSAYSEEALLLVGYKKQAAKQTFGYRRNC